MTDNSPTCKQLQHLIGTEGPAPLADIAGAEAHIADCDACYAILEARHELDATLLAMPEHDANDAVVKEIMAQAGAASEEDSPATRTARGPIPRWVRVGALAAGLTLFVVAGGYVTSRIGGSRVGDVAMGPMVPQPVPRSGPSNEDSYRGGRSDRDPDKTSVYDAPQKKPVSKARPPDDPRTTDNAIPPKGKGTATLQTQPEPADILIDGSGSVDTTTEFVGERLAAKLITEPGQHAFKKEGKEVTGKDAAQRDQAEQSALKRDRRLEGIDVGDDRIVLRMEEAQRGEHTVFGYAELENGVYARAPLGEEDGRQFELRGKRGRKAGEDLEGLTFKEASGYWQNSYIPGDPATRLLQARLSGYDRNLLQAFAAKPLRLDDAARQTAQPFDAPTNSALAVYLHADRPALSEKGRMLVQVGIQGTHRHSGRRPAMNVGIVLDLRTAPTTEQATAMRALLHAFTQARDLGDRFSLTIAGQPGAQIVPPDDFRHGPMTVTLQRLFNGESDARVVTPTPTLTLQEAMHTALQSVRGNDDPTSPLGSSAVVLVTASSIGAPTATLAQLAHRSAVDGIPVSVVGVGDQVNLRELDTLTLSGQGNRRLLRAASDARPLVDRELSSVSRVIARAVRLRIRLAPDVKLVDVIASRRLDEMQSQRVRDAEQSIDTRLNRNLGIVADRGDDEEGIQIVIPSYYASDAHVILLDVVAPGPGPVADVTVRYKDVVHLRNGITRDNLTLSRGPAVAGPLERNVLKNLLAHRLSEALQQAGVHLSNGNSQAALNALTTAHAQLLDTQRHVSGLATDRDLANDVLLVAEYLALLRSDAVNQQRQHLADSLNYAGRMKVQPRPEGP